MSSRSREQASKVSLPCVWPESHKSHRLTRASERAFVTRRFKKWNPTWCEAWKTTAASVYISWCGRAATKLTAHLHSHKLSVLKFTGWVCGDCTKNTHRVRARRSRNVSRDTGRVGCEWLGGMDNIEAAAGAHPQPQRRPPRRPELAHTGCALLRGLGQTHASPARPLGPVLPLRNARARAARRGIFCKQRGKR